MRVVDVRGERAVQPGDTVTVADSVVTGANGSASLVLRDGTALVLGPKTRIELKDFAIDDVSHKGNMLVSVLQGPLRMITGLISKANPALPPSPPNRNHWRARHRLHRAGGRIGSMTGAVFKRTAGLGLLVVCVLVTRLRLPTHRSHHHGGVAAASRWLTVFPGCHGQQRSDFPRRQTVPKRRRHLG